MYNSTQSHLFNFADASRAGAQGESFPLIIGVAVLLMMHLARVRKVKVVFVRSGDRLYDTSRAGAQGEREWIFAIY